jgi:hypothetical protein
MNAIPNCGGTSPAFNWECHQSSAKTIKSGREVAELPSLFEMAFTRKPLVFRLAPGVTRTHNLLIGSHYLQVTLSAPL